MKVSQNLSSVSYMHNPSAGAFCNLGLMIAIFNQFSDEWGEWICSVKTKTQLKAS